MGVPFSNYGMARSILWPRTTDGTSYFVQNWSPAFKEGGLLEASSNPGAATPEMLYRIYKDQAAATANPYVLRDINATSALTFGSTMGTSAATAPSTSNAQPQQRKKSGGAGAGPSTIGGVTAQERAAERESLLHQRASFRPRCRRWRPRISVLGERRGRGDSPPRGHFRVITHCAGSTAVAAAATPRRRSSTTARAADGVVADAEQFRHVAAVARSSLLPKRTFPPTPLTTSPRFSFPLRFRALSFSACCRPSARAAPAPAAPACRAPS